MTIELNEQIEIIYRKRKSFEIQIRPEKRIRIIAPQNASLEDVEEVLNIKRPWIIKKLKELESIQPCIFSFETGEKLLVGGCWREFVVHTPTSQYNLPKGTTGHTAIELLNEHLIIHTTTENSGKKTLLKSWLIDWYRQRTIKQVESYVNHWARIIGVLPQRIRIKDQKKRWGSCSSRGNLNFNWRLSMAPESVLEYIVIHELCHFLHMDHSKLFWNEVNRYCPNYKDHKNWLKENGQNLYILDNA